MLRQLTNLWHYGRVRSVARTERLRKPHFLKKNPELEIHNLLEVVTARYARSDSEFFFIQIGAFDGKASGDPLFQLVRQRHWRGILVEPQNGAFQLLQQNYEYQEGLQFFNVAIGPEDGEIKFYSHRNGPTALASAQRHLLVKPGLFRNEVISFTIPCWTLSTLMERANAPDCVDLLVIDAEGIDYEIIRSIDFQRIAPTIIRFEHQVLKESDRNSCLKLLAENGYRFFLEDCDTTAVRVD